MVKTHPVFKDNQVLTADHLNGVVAYLDGENRATRTQLVGVGIACGFGLHSDLASRVVVGKGCGVTTEGDLAVFPADFSYTHCRPFPPPAAYAPLATAINLVELLPAADPLDATVATIRDRITADAGFLADRVGVLFVERKEKNTRSCLEEDCDEKGARQEITLRVLLMRRADAEALVLWDKEPLLDERTSAAFPATGLFGIQRPALADLSAGGAGPLAQRYTTAVNASLPGLGADLARCIDRYAPLLGVSGAVNALQALEAARTSATSGGLAALQRLHDWMKDLAASLEEVWEAISRLGALCGPPAALFPRHLLLGRLQNDLAPAYRPPQVPSAPERHRYGFYPSPAGTADSAPRARAAALLQRLVLQLQTFTAAETGRVVVTPDAGPAAPLAQRSAPAYYRLRETVPRLIDQWNPARARNGWEEDVLSSRAAEYGSPIAREPLRFSHDRYPFFRVEGHAGLGVDTVLGELRSLRQQHGLPFRVLALSLDANATGLKGDDDCRSADLERGYALLRAQYLCALERERGYFSSLKAPPADKGRFKGKVVLDPAAGGFKGQAGLRILDTGELIPLDDDGLLEAELPRGTYVVQAVVGDQVGDRIVIDVRPGEETRQEFFMRGAQPGAARALRMAAAPEASMGRVEMAAKGTLGSEYLLAAARSSGKTVADYVYEFGGKNEALIDLAHVIAVFEGTGRGELVATVALPARLLGLLAQAIALLPEDVNQLDLAALERNAEELKTAAAGLAMQLVAAARGKPLDAERTLLLQHTLTVAGFCFVGPLRALAEASGASADRRRARLSFLGFLAEHPGLEHLGGVPRGGTLVLVYENGVVKADFALPYLCCDPCGAVVLRSGDDPSPPKEIRATLTSSAPVQTFTVPEAAGGAFILRSIVTAPGALAVIGVSDPKGKIRFEGKPKLFEQRAFSFEYLLEHVASKKVVLGKVFLDLVGDTPPAKPADETVRTDSPTKPLTVRPRATLDALVTIKGVKLADPKDGTVDVVERGKAFQFAPGQAFRNDRRAEATYELVRQGSATTVTGKVIILLEKEITRPGADVFVTIPKPGNTRPIPLPWLKDERWAIERIEETVRVGDKPLGALTLDRDKSELVFKAREGAFPANAAEAIYVAVDRKTGERVEGRVIFQLGKTPRKPA